MTTWTKVKIMLALGVGVAIAAPLVAKHRKLAPFREHLQEYLAQGSGKPSPGAGKAIHGKVVVVDRSHDDVDDITLSLPDALRPAQPDEVGAVVWLVKGKTLIGRYNGGGSGYQPLWDVSVIDFASHALIAEGHLEGGMPPDTVREKKGQHSDHFGSDPEVATWLLSLPRK